MALGKIKEGHKIYTFTKYRPYIIKDCSRVGIVNEKEPERRAPKAREWRRRRRRASRRRGRGVGCGAVPPPHFFLILDHEIAFLAHSGRYILQFSCLLYAQNPAIYTCRG